MSKIVLITGCSTGIGHDVAQRLAQAGYTVIATARKVETLDDLQVALKLPLDVTQPKSVHQAVESVMQQFGRIDVLVNNAGYAVYGAVEEVSDEKIRQMYDVNVFGLLHMIREVVPHMRQQGAGRIINISSIVGKLVLPVNGTYASTKFSVEALSNALRLELAPFGIQVVLVEPGGIKTQFSATANAHAQEMLTNPQSPYQTLYKQFKQVTANMSKQSPGPQVVSQVIQRAMEAPKPKARYVAGFPFPGRLAFYLGDSVWEFIARRMFKI
jgi:NADP-dependent 3-hydroxy acid dehydrogenase YdfG